MFETTDMLLHEAVARRQRGVLIGGDEGGRHVEEAERIMGELGIAEPGRLAGTMAPIPA